MPIGRIDWINRKGQLVGKDLDRLVREVVAARELSLPAGSLQSSSGTTIPAGAGDAGINLDHNGTLVGTRGTVNLIDGTNVALTVADNPGSDQVDLTIASKISVDHNGVLVGTRSAVNLIDGTNVTLTVADNPGADRVDVTIASTGGGGVTTSSVSKPALTSQTFTWAGAPGNPTAFQFTNTGGNTQQNYSTGSNVSFNLANPTRFTVNATGFYRATFTMLFTASLSQSFDAQLKINGTTLLVAAYGDAEPISSSAVLKGQTPTLTISADLSLNANDYIECIGTLFSATNPDSFGGAITAVMSVTQIH